MRCTSCNKALSNAETQAEHPSGGAEDLCRNCIHISTREYSYSTDHEFTLETVREGLTSALPGAD